MRRFRLHNFPVIGAALEATLEFARAVDACKARANDVRQARL